MIIFAGIATFATALTALYCASESGVRWFRILVSVVVSFVIALLVLSNLYY